MLPGVLLHVIEAPVEIDPPAYFAVSRVASTRSQRFAQNMRDAVAFVDHFHDTRSAQFASIERLATRGWIERSAVEINAATVPIYLHHMSFELGQIAILIIKALGHSASIMARRLARSFETPIFSARNGREARATIANCGCFAFRAERNGWIRLSDNDGPHFRKAAPIAMSARALVNSFTKSLNSGTAQGFVNSSS